MKREEPKANGDPPGSLRVTMTSMVSLEDADHLRPRVSLLLALPRPLALQRILPMVAQMGVERIILCNAKKVPKDYFGSHLFRKEGEIPRLLVEGLCQAGDCRLPEVTVVRRLKIFLEDDLERMFPEGGAARVIAHPARTRGSELDPVRMRDVRLAAGGGGKGELGPRILLAVGPEGGWDEDYELDMFSRHGFELVTLGHRTLRTDVAVISLLSQAQDACDAVTSAEVKINS